ncbi:Leucine-rich repeat containing protein [Entamoeba marina]
MSFQFNRQIFNTLLLMQTFQQRFDYKEVLYYLPINEVMTFSKINSHCRQSCETLPRHPTNLSSVSFLTNFFPLFTKINCRLSLLPQISSVPDWIELAVIADSPQHKNLLTLHARNIVELHAKDSDSFLPFPNFQHLTSLSIRCTPSASPFLINEGHRFPLLKRLAFYSITTDTSNEIAALSSFRSLQDVNIEFLELKKTTLKPFMESISTLHNITFKIIIHNNTFQTLDYDQIDSVLDAPQWCHIIFHNVDLRDNYLKSSWEYIMSKVYSEPLHFFLKFTPGKFPMFAPKEFDRFVNLYVPDYPSLTISKRLESAIPSLELYPHVELLKTPASIDFCTALKSLTLSPIYGDKTRRDIFHLSLTNCGSMTSLVLESLQFTHFDIGTSLRGLTMTRCLFPPTLDITIGNSLTSVSLVESKVTHMLLPVALAQLHVVACEFQSINFRDLTNLTELNWKYYTFTFELPPCISVVRFLKIKTLTTTNYEDYPTLKTLFLAKIANLSSFSVPSNLECLSLNNASNLVSLNTLANLHHLTFLEIGECSKLVDLTIPYNLQVLRLQQTPLTRLIIQTNGFDAPVLRTLSLSSMNDSVSFTSFCKLQEINISDCEFRSPITFPDSLQTFHASSSILPDIDFSACSKLTLLSTFNAYPKSLCISPQVESLKLMYLSTLIPTLGKVNHLTSLTLLELSCVNTENIDLTSSQRLKRIDFRGVTYKTIRYPTALENASFKFSYSNTCPFEFENLPNLTTIEIITCVSQKHSFPTSLKSLMIRHSPQFLFRTEELQQLTNLTQLVLLDVPITTPIQIDNYPNIETFSYRPIE